MIRKWLSKNKEDKNTYSFSKVEFIEISEIDESILDYIGLNLLEAFRDKKALKYAYKDEPKEKLINYLKTYVLPNIEEQVGEQNIRKNVRQGDFGETVAMELVEKFDNMQIPICKIRWKFNNNRSVFCTDMISHNFGEKITDLRYYEIKSRLTMKKEKVKINNEDKSHYIGVVAHQGLFNDQQSPNTEAIADYLFRYYFDIAERFDSADIIDKAEEYYGIAAKYSDIVKHPDKYNKSYEIIIIVEKSLFQEKILEELNTLPPKLYPLEVKVILIDELRSLYEKAYERSIEQAVREVYTDEKRGVL